VTVAIELTPFFLPGTAGRLFAVHLRPAAVPAPGEAVLLVPPLHEEMNKSRPMLAAQARRFASLGLSVLMLDPYGTGDSEGEFGEASLEQWIQDLAAGSRWLRETGAQVVHLWAARAGALLLAPLLAIETHPGAVLTLWQPVLTGKQLVTQWLRLRIASETGRERGESSESLRRQLEDEGRLEIGGYELSARLVAALEPCRLDAALAADWRGIAWFDVAASPLPASERALAPLRTRGMPLVYEALPGEPFWGTPEIARLPELLEATSRSFAQLRDGGAP